MRTSQIVTLAVVCGSMLVAGPVSAASDYYLKIDTIEGESTKAPVEPLEVASYSFGASQMSATSREAASGMASGKRQHKPVSIAADERTVATAVAPATDSIKTLSLTVAEPGNETAAYLVRMCASGEHIPRAVLTSRNERFELKDAIVTSCVVTGNQRKHELKGHVTLIR